MEIYQARKNKQREVSLEAIRELRRSVLHCKSYGDTRGLCIRDIDKVSRVSGADSVERGGMLAVETKF